MHDIIEITQTQEERVISLYKICKVMDKRHGDAKKLAEEIQAKDGFGTVRKIRIVYNDKGQEIDTYSYSKKQALMIGARLDSSNIIKLVNKLEQTTRPLTFEEMVKQTILLADKKIKELTHKIEEKNKVILAVADLNIKAGNITISDFSKNLAIEGLGRNNLFSWLKGCGFIMMNTEPYQPYVERGYFVRKPSKKKINGEVRYTTMLTPKGSVWLTKLLKTEFELDEEVA